MPRCWNCRVIKQVYEGSYVDDEFECTPCSIDLEGKYGYSTDAGKKGRAAKEKSNGEGLTEKSKDARKEKRRKGDSEAK